MEETNPADHLISGYNRADSLAAWSFEMMHRCKLTKGASAAQVLAFLHADTFDRQFDYTFHFPGSFYQPPAPYYPDSLTP